VQKLGDPRAQLNAVMAQAQGRPPLVTYRDAITGESKQERLHARPRRHAGAHVRLRAAGRRPAAAGVERGRAGRYEPLMALSKLLSSTDRRPDHARHAAVGDLHRGRRAN
jgi:hypothetical protein